LLRSVAEGDIEIRYHFPLGHVELAAMDPDLGDEALKQFKAAVDVLTHAGGRYLTVHAALHTGAQEFPVYSQAKARLRALVEYGLSQGVTVCLENLRWGLTSQPRHFMDLVAGSGAAVTFDVGHAVSSDIATTGETSGADFARMMAPRIVGAHVYDREDPHHIAPTDLVSIGPTLKVLLAETLCEWWVIELFSAEEVRSTRQLLLDFLRQQSPEPVPAL
jgi:sugar phosphate isomerase/epimerase